MRRFLNERRHIEALDGLPRPLLGLSVVMITPDGEVLVKKRGRRVGAYPDTYHVVPSCIVAPVRDLDSPSIALTFVRELDEEMFRESEGDLPIDRLLAKKHIKELKGKLNFLGYALDLMHGDLNVLASFEIGSEWWGRYRDSIRLNWEYAEAVPECRERNELVLNAERSPSEFVPAAAVALRFMRSEDEAGDLIRGGGSARGRRRRGQRA